MDKYLQFLALVLIQYRLLVAAGLLSLACLAIAASPTPIDHIHPLGSAHPRMCPLSNSELSQAYAQGIHRDLEQAALKSQLPRLNTIKPTGLRFKADQQVLDADITITGVKYPLYRLGNLIDADGNIVITLPNEIEEISIKNLRVLGAPRHRTLGDLFIRGIRFHENSQISIQIRD